MRNPEDPECISKAVVLAGVMGYNPIAGRREESIIEAVETENEGE
jgi:hypothetical protein